MCLTLFIYSSHTTVSHCFHTSHTSASHTVFILITLNLAGVGMTNGLICLTLFSYSSHTSVPHTVLILITLKRAGVGMTNGLIGLRQMLDPSFFPPNPAQDVLTTSATYGLYMAVSSNLRYQVIAGGWRFSGWRRFQMCVSHLLICVCVCLCVCVCVCQCHKQTVHGSV